MMLFLSQNNVSLPSEFFLGDNLCNAEPPGGKGSHLCNFTFAVPVFFSISFKDPFFSGLLFLAQIVVLCAAGGKLSWESRSVAVMSSRKRTSFWAERTR